MAVHAARNFRLRHVRLTLHFLTTVKRLAIHITNRAKIAHAEAKKEAAAHSQ
jgi:hypothetical protein